MTFIPNPPVNQGALAKVGVTAPPSRPATTTATPSLYQQAIDQAQAALQAQITPIQGQIASNDATTAQRVSDATANAQALSELLKSIAPAIQGTYTQAADTQGTLAKGFSTDTQAALDQNASGIDKTLAGIGAPAGQNIDPTQSGKVADVLYGLGGFIPGSTFAQKGAAYAGAAAMLPAGALLQGLSNAQQVRLAGQAADTELQNKIAELAGKLPGDVQTNYQALQKAALDNAKFAESLRHNKVSEGQAQAKINLDVGKANVAIQEFNIRSGQAQQRLQLDANKFARAQFQQDRQYAVSLQRLGISEKSLQLRIAAAAYTQAHGGYSAKQVAGFNQKMDALVAAGQVHTVDGVMPGPQVDKKTGKALPYNSYSNFVKAALKKGVPVQLALERANSVWPETERGNLGSLMGLPAVAAQAAQQARDYKQTTGQILGTSPGGVDIKWAASTNLSAKGKTAVSNVLFLAQEYLGTPYAWGGESPTGFDCSGLAQYIYAKSGINIPRTTYAQFQSGLAVPKNQLQPGDLVFFNGSDARNGLPGHVGIYIGNGLMIQAPRTGDVVKVSSLSGFPGYRGARRFVH